MIKTLLPIIKPWPEFEKRALFLKVTKLFASAKFLQNKNLVGIIYFGAIAGLFCVIRQGVFKKSG